MRIHLHHLFQRKQKSSAKTNPAKRDTLRYVISLLNRFIGDRHRALILALVMLVAEQIAQVAEPFPLAYLIDYLKNDRPDLWAALGLPPVISPFITTIAVLTVAIPLMAMINSLGDSLAEIYFAQVGRALGYNLRLALYRHLQRLSLAFHNQRRTGDILTRVTGDVSAIEDFVIKSLSDIAGSLLLLVITLAALLYQSWQIVLVAMAIIPPLVIVSNYFAKRIKAATKQQRAREGELASATEEMLTSIRVIQTYNRGDYELKRFAEHNQKSVEAAFQAAVLQARYSWVVDVLEALAISVVIWVGVWLIYRIPGTPVLSVGTLIMIILQLKNMFKPTRKIIKEWNTLGKVYASVERVGELLDRKPAVVDLPNAKPAPALRGQIEFKDVGFTYQSNLEDPDAAEAEDNAQPALRQALQKVNFQVAPGEVLALVGHTGAGKSTIIQLLPRLYDPTEGAILVDGNDIRRFTIDSLRNQISVVLQETVLFNGTVAENIAYGRADASREEIIQAAVQANAHRFIEKMPEGYDTMLGERGSNLSGGQRQRIAIARAFVRNTPILILDEPTTGLDAESSELVLLALRMLMKGKTTIIISHDFKLVRQAAKIVVLKDGRIEQMGTHQELIKTQGIYENLYVKQFGQPKPGDEAVATVEGSLYDLLSSPVFLEKWPAMRMAFDAEVMRTQLQSAFFEATSDDCTITRCKPGKATFVEGEGCRLRYDLQVTQTSTGQVHKSLLLARLFATQEEAETYLEKRLMPLAAKMQGRPELELFGGDPVGAVALLDSLNMVVSVFPIDPELPVLVPVTDRAKMTEVLRETLPGTVDERLLVEDCTVDPGHYGRQHRCVLRYEVAGSLVNDDPVSGESVKEPVHKVVYGKVAADDRSKLVCMALTALHMRMDSSKGKRRFQIPHILGYRPNLRLILLEALPGTPRIPELIEARVAGKENLTAGALTLERALKDCAFVAATLHRTDIKLGKRRTFADEVTSLQAQLRPVEEFSLALAMELQSVIRRIQAYADQTKAAPLCFSHGDFTYTQLIFDDSACGLVDFDTVCQAEPALDLGQFLAYLRLTARKIQQQSAGKAALAADELCSQFVDDYLHMARYTSAEADVIRARVAMYEIISLIRITLHSWQKMKGSRLELVVDLLEERSACLPTINPAVNAQRRHKAVTVNGQVNDQKEVA